MTDISALREFVSATTGLVERHGGDEQSLVTAIRPLLKTLVETDGWLPEEFTRPDPQYYQQYLLHADPQERWSVVSFVWGPGQKTPIHDHRVWGLVGVYQGAETSTGYERLASGALHEIGVERLERGDLTAVSPTIGDIHRVANAYSDRVSISVHVYGGNIGAVARAVYDETTGAEKPFVSGYSNATVPNLWDRSSAVRSSIKAVL